MGLGYGYVIMDNCISSSSVALPASGPFVPVVIAPRVILSVSVVVPLALVAGGLIELFVLAVVPLILLPSGFVLAISLGSQLSLLLSLPLSLPFLLSLPFSLSLLLPFPFPFPFSLPVSLFGVFGFLTLLLFTSLRDTL